MSRRKTKVRTRKVRVVRLTRRDLQLICAVALLAGRTLEDVSTWFRGRSRIERRALGCNPCVYRTLQRLQLWFGE